MAESSTDLGSGWYHHPDALLNELQRGGVKSSRRPVVNGYENLREIASGGQGEVYEAFHASLKRRVAIKILRDRILASEASRLRFEREVDLVAGLQHPNIVRVYDRGLTSDGKHYFSMEYIDGQSLSDYLSHVETSERKYADAENHLQLFAAICDAVSFAHQKGVVHRDLNPNNILIDADGNPHVVDFGLAKIAEPHATETAVTVTGEFMGTLAYASPEQVAGDPLQIDIRTDVYSLGVILYEMLAGRKPFSTSTPMADLIRAITEAEPEPPSRVRRQTQMPRRNRKTSKRWSISDLDTIALKALAKNPDRRYQSVAALREDVIRALSGLPIEAKRDSAWYLFKKLLQRRKATAAIIVAFIVLVIGFNVALSVMYQQQASKEKRIRIFWEDTLGSVGPPAAGRDVTMTEVLDETEHWIEIATSGEPLLEGSLRNTIGNSYRCLDRFDKAEKQLRLALETRREHFGDEHVEVAQSLNLLALLRRDQGDYEEANRLFKQVLSMRRRLLGEDHLDVAQVLQNMAVSAFQQNRLKEAEPLFREALAIRLKHRGDRHPDVAMCQYQLAKLSEQQGNHEAADQLHVIALDTRRAMLHPEHPDIARSLAALGGLLMRTDKSNLAEPYLRECVGIMTQIVSEDHWKVAEAESALGECMTAMERYDEAETLLIRSHAVIETTRGPHDELARQSVGRLIRLYDAWGKPALAERYR